MPIDKRFGWKRDLPDFRDLLFSVPISREVIPAAVDLRGLCPPIYDQDGTNSCVGNSVAAVCHANELAQQAKSKPTIPSRLFIYYNARKAIGEERMDNGATIRDAVKSLRRYGFCPEAWWPFRADIVTKTPPKKDYDIAKKEIINQYARVAQDANAIEATLAQKRFIVFGFAVYDNLLSGQVARSGTLTLPLSNERLLGGHAVVLVGYDRAARTFLVRNSWGINWGKQGYFTMPYDYVLNPNLAADFWTMGFA